MIPFHQHHRPNGRTRTSDFLHPKQAAYHLRTFSWQSARELNPGHQVEGLACCRYTSGPWFPEGSNLVLRCFKPPRYLMRQGTGEGNRRIELRLTRYEGVILPLDQKPGDDRQSRTGLRRVATACLAARTRPS